MMKDNKIVIGEIVIDNDKFLLNLNIPYFNESIENKLSEAIKLIEEVVLESIEKFNQKEG